MTPTPRTDALIDRLYDDDKGGDEHLLMNWQTVEMNDFAREIERELAAIRDAITSTGLTEDEGSTLGMASSICDLAKDRVKLADALRAQLATAQEALRACETFLPKAGYVYNKLVKPALAASGKEGA